jgi:Fur family peroxide stress response transcriptional regulator
MSSLSPATVYRVLEFLEREGLVRRVSTTEGAGRFDANISEHQHLVCRVCGSMVDFEPAMPVRIELPRAGIKGFVAEEFDVRIIGKCGQCRSTPPRSGCGGAGNHK